VPEERPVADERQPVAHGGADLDPGRTVAGPSSAGPSGAGADRHRGNAGGGADLGGRLRERDLTAAPAALNLLESTAAGDREQAAALLGEVSPAKLGGEAPGHIVGVTGPPGAGKSTLLSALLGAWRGTARDADGRGATVAMLAVDPRSRRSGGSLLGDRARVEFDPNVRGVGQAETEVAEVADTVVVVVQPGSGDVLQFLKSGIMEIPDLLVVTKADLGQVALNARRDLSAALRSLGRRSTRVLAVSSLPPAAGIGELLEGLQQRWQELGADGGHALAERRLRARRAGALTAFVVEHGERGLRALGGRRAAERWLADQSPALDEAALAALLQARMTTSR
jgi:LAO/AO transport system kinase